MACELPTSKQGKAMLLDWHLHELMGQVPSLAGRADLNGRDGSAVSYATRASSALARPRQIDGEAKAMLLRPSCEFYDGPVFEDAPELVGFLLQFNAEHLVGHALRGQVRCGADFGPGRGCHYRLPATWGYGVGRVFLPPFSLPK